MNYKISQMLLKCSDIMIKVKESSDKDFNLIISQMIEGRLEK